MSYFKRFPKSVYDFNREGVVNSVVDLFRQVRPIQNFVDDFAAYKFYSIKNGERPDIVSQRIYGSSQLYWTFFLVNDSLHDGLGSWPMSQENLTEYLNIEYRRLRSKTFIKFLENYNKKLSSRDADKYVDGDADVVDLAKIINDFALLRNQWLGITKGLDQKQWQITNIVKLRVAGMEDANIR